MVRISYVLNRLVWLDVAYTCFLWIWKHETLRGYAAQIPKNQVKNVGKWFLGAKGPKINKLINLPVLVFLEADDLCEIFDQSNDFQQL